jgi:hypothetical protein
VSGLAWDLHAGCAYCGHLGADLVPDPTDSRELVCRGCLALDAAPAVTIAGIAIPAAELTRPEASIASRARAVLDLVVADDASPVTIRREGREMDRAVARLVREDAAAALTAFATRLRKLPASPCGEEVDDVARAFGASMAAAMRAVRWEQGRSEARSMARRGRA